MSKSVEKRLAVQREGEIKPHVERTIYGSGKQLIFWFPNGYGASVVKHYASYGYSENKWELAVIKSSTPNVHDAFTIVYDTPITNDVLGHLTWRQVQATLKKIAELKED